MVKASGGLAGDLGVPLLPKAGGGGRPMSVASNACASTDSWPLLRRHQFSYSRFKDLVLALVGLCNRLIVFIGREPGNCCFTILELSDQQDIAYGQSWKLVRFLASLVGLFL
jgi:hypothetical protein